MKVRNWFRFYMAPADGGGGGGAEDRGDDWTPTEDDDPAVAAAAAAEAEAAAAALQADKDALKVVKTAEELAAEEAAKTAKTDEEAKAKAKDTRIPAARHKEILDKERERREAVEAELAKYKQGSSIAATNAEITAAETKLLTLEEEHAQLSLDGKVREAALKMGEIRRTERSILEATAVMREQAAEIRAVETVRYDMACDRVEEAYPQLDTKSDQYDRALSAEVIELQNAYKAMGHTPTVALQKAVKLIMPAATTAKQADAVKVEPKVDPKAVEEQRKVDAKAKTAEAVGKTPASTAKVGANSDTKGGGAVTAKDVMKMSFKDFDNLDENVLAAARGDTYAGS